jgi:hypothetical protein
VAYFFKHEKLTLKYHISESVKFQQRNLMLYIQNKGARSWKLDAGGAAFRERINF